MESCALSEPPRKSPSPSEPSSSQSYSSKEPTPGPSSSYQNTNDDATMSLDVLLESIISSIQEMLPDLGSGFLKVCNFFILSMVIPNFIFAEMPGSLQNGQRGCCQCCS